jgi:hypothetical protein
MSRKPKLDKTLTAMLRKGEKRPPARPREERVGPTPERLAKGDLMQADMPDGTHKVGRGERVATVRVVSSAPLDRYRRDGNITEAQYRAGCRLRRDWAAGEGSRRLIALYGERTTDTGEITDSQAERRHEYILAMHALGPELSPVVVHVVLLEGPASAWAEERGRRGVRAREHGMTALCLGLDRLSRHYRLTGGVPLS